MHDAVEVAARGKTAVAVVTEEFEVLAHTMAANAGRPGLRVHVLPYPLETRPEAEVRAVAAGHWPAVLATLGATPGGSGE
ncbi:MAG: hypothetical protein KatS3mg009_1939 [Acidimicrobiia bacterium]|nr:MAG: hypothetical protein KatS3mg009_1939 [Acidimicrobiia bacterium]